jgi:hypothetical protein
MEDKRASNNEVTGHGIHDSASKEFGDHHDHAYLTAGATSKLNQKSFVIS